MIERSAQVLTAIGAGHRTNRAIQRYVLGAVASSGYDRDVDGALQKLRRQGKIVVRDRQWFLAEEPKPCSRCHGTGKEPPPSR
jgi:hypothetical protein